MPGPLETPRAAPVAARARARGLDLAAFEPIGLAEMDGVALLDRTDTKFLLRRIQLPELLRALARDYRALEIDGVRLAAYETLYLDTADRRFYRNHHNGRLPRLKVRFRRYVDSDLAFVEVKTKTRRGRTDKQRVAVPGIPERLEGDAWRFVEERTRLAGALVGSLWVEFDRLTLVHKTIPERLTLDLNLAFGHVGGGGERRYPELVVGELKQGKRSRLTDGYAAFRRLGVRPEGMSKYCLGSIAIRPGLKHNAFKPTLLTIAKLGR